MSEIDVPKLIERLRRVRGDLRSYIGPGYLTIPMDAEQAADALASTLNRIEGGEFDLRTQAQAVVDTFKRDEAEGFHSRDRHYAITMLEPALSPPEAKALDGKGEVVAYIPQSVLDALKIHERINCWVAGQPRDDWTPLYRHPPEPGAGKLREQVIAVYDRLIAEKIAGYEAIKARKNLTELGEHALRAITSLRDDIACATAALAPVQEGK